jgi:50S ribosomal subunit-associated GTPase HflX
VDAAAGREALERLVRHCRRRKVPCVAVSAATGRGLPELLREIDVRLPARRDRPVAVPARRSGRAARAAARSRGEEE